MLSPKTKRNIFRILPFGIIWMVAGMIYAFVEKGILGDFDYYPSTNNPYDFKVNFFVNLVFATVTGLLVGAFEIMYLSKRFVRNSLGEKLLYKTLIYIAIMLSFLIINTVISNSIRIESNIFSLAVWSNVWSFFSNFAFWSIQIYMAVIILTSLFYTEVSENLGQEVLYNFFTGKYHRPVEEERIFMFLDMKSSTTIAEKMGHVRYFEMLKEYYADLSEPIIECAGEIYDYVGDEIIVSWKLKKGLQSENCLHCFFLMKETLEKQSDKYIEKYGLLPSFKAGLHYGEVTTGEIGTIKKDIVFSGDVLNTTARIQGLCNSYEVDILISAKLKEKIKSDTELKFKPLGESELRGRDKKVELYTVSKNA